MPAEMPPLDDERIQKLFHAILAPVLTHYRTGPTGPARVFEVLNALAALVAVVAVGTGEQLPAFEFFAAALNVQLPEAQAKYAEVLGDRATRH